MTQSILDRIPAKDAKCTYVYDRFLFHYVREDGITYLCMGDEAFGAFLVNRCRNVVFFFTPTCPLAGRRIPFSFLQAVQNDFKPFAPRVRLLF